jgi:hypothetical protein
MTKVFRDDGTHTPVNRDGWTVQHPETGSILREPSPAEEFGGTWIDPYANCDVPIEEPLPAAPEPAVDYGSLLEYEDAWRLL